MTGDMMQIESAGIWSHVTCHLSHFMTDILNKAIVLAWRAVASEGVTRLKLKRLKA